MSDPRFAASSQSEQREILDSWKEIALYLRREVRTVQRWEKSEGLPVHRHFHKRLGSVYAFKSELDEWLAERDAIQPEVQTLSRQPDRWELIRPGDLTRRKVVGRERERLQLQSAFECAKSGKGLIACVAGDAGMGKTTFVESFLEGVLKTAACFVACGRSSERLGGAEAYLPFLEAFESLFHRDHSGELSGLMRRLAPTWYLEIVPDWDTKAPDTITPETRRERMRRELMTLLKALSEQRPLILFFDDLHWTDISTVDLISHLSGDLSSLRVLLILTYRPPELLLSQHPFLRLQPDLKGRGLCREIALNYLTPDDIRRYVDLEFTGNAFAEDLAQLIFEKTEGNPLFMVDLLRDLSSREIISNQEGEWSLTGEISAIDKELPESIRGMIERKVGRLSDYDRQMLSIASIEGQEFNSAILGSILDMGAVDVEERLEVLDRIHFFIRVIREDELPDGTLTLRYKFVHVLYQNALFAAITPSRKQQWSAAVAKAIRKHYADEHTLASAQLALLLEAAREFAASANYYLASAQQAARVFANQEAIVLAQRGLEILARVPTSPERFRDELELQMALRIPLAAVKGYGAPEVEKVYRRIRELSSYVEDPRDLFPVIWGEYLFYVVRADLKTAQDRARELHELALKFQDQDALVQAEMALTVLSFHKGRFPETWKRFTTNIQLADASRAPSHTASYTRHPAVTLRCVGAFTSWALGFPDEALRLSHDAVDLARSIDHPHALINALVFAAWVRQYRGEIQECSDLIEESGKLFASHGLHTWRAWLLGPRGWVLLELGCIDESIELIERRLREDWVEGMELYRPAILAVLAEGYLRKGLASRSILITEEAIRLMDETGQRHYASELFCLRGEALVANSKERHSGGTRTAEAEKCFQKALEIAAEQQAKSFELKAAMSLCQLHRQMGKKEGERIIRSVYEWFTEGFDTVHLKQARALLGKSAPKPVRVVEPPALGEQ